ncbi:MAG: hypothetical protein KAR40_17815 [Candidatus Sabulitectum sp.]|nr:hypothetical protein [Candidatus Sabulitectum sp.]
MISVCAFLLVLTAYSPLLDVTDTMDRGATAVYTISLDNETVYWIILESVDGQTNFDVVTASSEMDFDHFMSLPYREDFFYALEFAIVSGLEDGNESVTLPAQNSGLVYVVVHDAGGNGGLFSLKIH